MFEATALLCIAAFGLHNLNQARKIIKHPRVPTAGTRGIARWNRMVAFERVLLGVGCLVIVAAVLLAR